MQENQKKAFDFASDLTKQLITLSTAIITLSVTFSKDIIGGIAGGQRYLILVIWGLYFLSILFGLLTLMALTGNLDPMPTKQKDNKGAVSEQKPEPIITITSSNIISTSRLQVLTFLVALGLTCWFGYSSVSEKNYTSDSDQRNKSYLIIRKSYLGNDTTLYIDSLWVPKK